MKLKTLVLSFIFATAPAMLSAKQRSQPLINPDVAVPAGVTLDAAQQVVRTVLTTRGWTITQEKSGEIQASWQKQAISAAIRATINGKSVSVRHVSSAGLSYEKGASGEMIHPRYNIWMRNLQKDFGVGLSAAPRK